MFLLHLVDKMSASLGSLKNRVLGMLELIKHFFFNSEVMYQEKERKVETTMDMDNRGDCRKWEWVEVEESMKRIYDDKK